MTLKMCPQSCQSCGPRALIETDVVITDSKWSAGQQPSELQHQHVTESVVRKLGMEKYDRVGQPYYALEAERGTP